MIVDPAIAIAATALFLAALVFFVWTCVAAVRLVVPRSRTPRTLLGLVVGMGGASLCCALGLVAVLLGRAAAP